MCRCYTDSFDKAWDQIAQEIPTDSCPYEQWINKPGMIITEDTARNASSCVQLLLELESMLLTNPDISEDKVAIRYSMVYKRSGLEFRDKFGVIKPEVYKKGFFEKEEHRRRLLEELKKRWYKLGHERKLKAVSLNSSESKGSRPNFHDKRQQHKLTASTEGESPAAAQCNVTMSGSRKQKKECSFCKREHHLRSCSNFKRQEQKAKASFIRDRNLCLKCLEKAVVNHECLNLQCHTCGESSHCSTAHGLELGTNTTSSMITTAETCVIRLLKPHDDQLILLDTGSDKTFISDSTAGRWGLK